MLPSHYSSQSLVQNKHYPLSSVASNSQLKLVPRPCSASCSRDALKQSHSFYKPSNNEVTNNLNKSSQTSLYPLPQHTSNGVIHHVDDATHPPPPSTPPKPKTTPPHSFPFIPDPHSTQSTVTTTTDDAAARDSDSDRFSAAQFDSMERTCHNRARVHLARRTFGAAVFATCVGAHSAGHARTRLLPAEQRAVDIFKRNTASVVNITNLAQRRDAYTLDLREVPQGAGSGVVWDSQGHIITNFHVIKDASEVQMTLLDGSQYLTRVIGVDADKDIAVMQLSEDDRNSLKQTLSPIAHGSSSDLVVGQRVYAIGNPFGLDHTLTTGIISGTEREISTSLTGRPIQGVIQTDAAINPGNSGGPLLDGDGKLVGINTAIYSTSGANAGVGFAIPIDQVSRSVTSILTTGKVSRPLLGITFAPDASAQPLGVKGILVLSTREGGPAAKAGVIGTSRDKFGRLVLGDIIVGFNGSVVKNTNDLYKYLDRCGVGDSVELELLRPDKQETVTVVLDDNTALQL